MTLTPSYLYKIVSIDDWENSKGKKKVSLSKMDKDFIHLSTEEQLDRILKKYWVNHSEYVILKIKTYSLIGRLVYEANQGGKDKYYHLYDGAIPIDSIVKKNIVRKN